MKPAAEQSRKAEQSARTLQRVVSASMELFAHHGIRATSMDQIARRAGITKGAIYWHFHSKDALVEAILQRIQDDWQRVVLRRLDREAGPLEKVERLFENYRQLLSEEPEICLFLQRAMLQPNSKLSRRVNEVFDRTTTVVATVFDEGREAGLFVRDVDSKLLALSILSGFAGAVVHCHSDKSLRFDDLITEIRAQTIARLTAPNASVP